MARAQTKITKEMGIYEQAAYQAAAAEPERLARGSDHIEPLETTQMDPEAMRALLAQATPAKPPARPVAPQREWFPFWLAIAIALVPAVAYLTLYARL